VKTKHLSFGYYNAAMHQCTNAPSVVTVADIVDFADKLLLRLPSKSNATCSFLYFRSVNPYDHCCKLASTICLVCASEFWPHYFSTHEQ
jgi:hypothetical protein